jgi:hypothetical protein
MAGTNNFKQFNPDKNNQVSDTDYTNSSYRQDGAQTGEAPSNIHNKLFYQTSTMVAAIAQVMANKGFNVSDASLSTLIAVLTQAITNLNYCLIETNDGMDLVQLNGFVNLNLASGGSYGVLNPAVVPPGSFVILNNIGSYAVTLNGNGYTFWTNDLSYTTINPLDIVILYSDGVSSHWYLKKISSVSSVHLDGVATHFLRGDGTLAVPPYPVYPSPKMGSFTISASGAVNVTGVGFTPSAGIFLTQSTDGTYIATSIGFDNGTLHASLLFKPNTGGYSSLPDYAPNQSIGAILPAGNFVAHVSAWSSGGFTVTATKTGTISSATVYYIVWQ